MYGRLKTWTREAWGVLAGAVLRFVAIDGTQWAGAFAFNAFFSLFPLLILAVALAAFFVDQQTAAHAIIAMVERYIPLEDELRARISAAVEAVITTRTQQGMVAFAMLIWSALQCFTTLIQVTNRAWHDEDYSWWRLPVRGMAILGVAAGAVLVGMAAPVIAGVGKAWLFPAFELGASVYALWGFAVPLVVLFASLALFYRLAPRRSTRFSEVWLAAACVTVLLQASESLFLVYLTDFAPLNASYGVFGGITALLLWIYLSGCAFIFGACLCASAAEARAAPAPSPPAL